MLQWHGWSSVLKWRMTVFFFLLRTFLYETMMFRLTLKRLPVQFLHVKSLESVTPILTTRKNWNQWLFLAVLWKWGCRENHHPESWVENELIREQVSKINKENKNKCFKSYFMKGVLDWGSGLPGHIWKDYGNSWERKPPKGRQNQGEVLNHPEPRGCGWEDFEVFVIPVCVQVLNPWIS